MNPLVTARQLRDAMLDKVVQPMANEMREIRTVQTYQGKVGYWINIEFPDRTIFVEVTEMRRR